VPLHELRPGGDATVIRLQRGLERRGDGSGRDVTPSFGMWAPAFDYMIDAA